MGMRLCRPKLLLIRRQQINKTMRALSILLLLLTLASFVMAQESAPSRPINNDDIVQLSRAGVVASIVIEKIKTSQCKFDTSPSALVALKQAGVADEVLMEMLRSPNGGAQPTATAVPTRAPEVDGSRAEASKSRSVGEPDATTRPPMTVKRDPSTFRNKSRFSTEYDKFKDQTHVRVGPFFVGGTKSYVWSGFQLEMSVHFFCKGHMTSQPRVFYLAFWSSSKDWTFLRSRDLYALVDGERLELGEGDHDSDVELGGVSERLIYRLSPDVFSKLGAAQHVELKIGNVELTLKDEHLEAFRDFYSLGQP